MREHTVYIIFLVNKWLMKYSKKQIKIIKVKKEKKIFKIQNHFLPIR